MSEQTRLIQTDDLPLFTGVPDEAPADLEITDRDRWLLVAQQLADEQEHRLQLQRDVREWMSICEGLRAMLEQAKAQVEAMADANAEVSAEYIHARRCANTWKAAAKNQREARIILQVVCEEYEAHGRIAPIPVAGVLTGHMEARDWRAIHAAIGVGDPMPLDKPA
jgi:hypothetical protein